MLITTCSYKLFFNSFLIISYKILMGINEYRWFVRLRIGRRMFETLSKHLLGNLTRSLQCKILKINMTSKHIVTSISVGTSIRALTSIQTVGGAICRYQSLLLVHEMAWTNQQMFEIVMVYAECHREYTTAAATFNERFAPEVPLTRKGVKSIVERLRDTGSFAPRPKSGRPRVRTGEQQTPGVLERFTQNPHTSSRAVGTAVGMSHQSVLRILHAHRYHPYHVHLHQAIRADDPELRVQFCGWLDGQFDVDPDFSRKILWSDEASFSRDGCVNLHNAHYWAIQNPHWLRTTHHQDRFRVNVWGGILNDTLLGPVFLPPHLTGQSYLDFLSNDLENLLDDIPLEVERTMWFQHDGAPPHFDIRVRDHLRRRFPERWIGRGGPVSWPPRSPDLSPLDFFLWGFIKQKVYESDPGTADELRNRISRSFAEVPKEMLVDVRANMTKRLRMCIATEGQNFEHILPR